MKKTLLTGLFLLAGLVTQAQNEITIYTPNYWIRIAKEASLSTSDGKQYKVLKTDGITLDKEFFMPESGEAEFSLTFEPLPKDAQTFTFQEGNGENVWTITGI